MVLNDLNLSLQGSNANRILCFQKVQAFMNKLPLWKKRIAKGNTANFKLLDLKLNDADASAALIQNITEHLSDLEIKAIRRIRCVVSKNHPNNKGDPVLGNPAGN